MFGVDGEYVEGREEEQQAANRAYIFEPLRAHSEVARGVNKAHSHDLSASADL